MPKTYSTDKKSSTSLNKSLPEKENSQPISTELQSSIKTETKFKLKKTSSTLSTEQLQEAILMGSMLADQSELMKLKQKFLEVQKLKTIRQT